MNAFRFSLERVLSWHRTQLAIAEADLERLRSELQLTEVAITELASRQEAAIASMGKAQSVTGSDIADLARSRDWAVCEEKRLRANLVDCERRIELQSETVSEGRRKVRLLERLKERRHDFWIDESNRELEQLASESALSGWRRDRRDSSEKEVPAPG